MYICRAVLACFCFLAFTLTSAENVAKVDGDVYIAGLFEVEKKKGDKCGAIDKDSVMVLEATRWYIEKLNENNVLPFKLGFQGYNTCGLPRVAAERALDIVGRHKRYNRTSDDEEFFLGFIGPTTSEESQRVSEALTLGSVENSFLQISVSATTTVLGDSQMYPNYYSVLPDDSKQIEIMIQLMRELDWNRIAVIYEDNIYCKTCVQSFVDQAKQNLICISKQFSIDISNDGDVSVDQINSFLDEIMQQPPVIGGVVLFASKDVAKKVMFAVDTKGVTDVPLFILSESAGLKDEVFMTDSGTLMQKTKGSMVVSPPFTEITSFSEYWSSMMTNITLLKERSVANPWLTAVFKSVKECDPVVSPCQGLTTSEIKSAFPKQPVYLKYGIVAAHTMAKASFLLYNRLCPDNSTDCLTDFKNQFRPSHMIDEMQNLTINFGTDFPAVPLEPLTSSNYQMTFGISSGFGLASDLEVYQVYNFQQFGSGAENFALVKVGSLGYDHNVDVNFEALRDYSAEGEELRYPNLRKGQCPVQKKCTECINPGVTDLFMHTPGDLYVIGIVPVHDKSVDGPIGCGPVRAREGYQLALALQFGLNMFSSSSDYLVDREKFGNKTVGLIVLDSCYNNITTARKILQNHEFGMTLENGKQLDFSDKILGYVGGLASWVSLSAATQLTITGHVQISYGSTYPTLSDSILYPYFLRIVSPDGVQAEAMMEVVKAMKGKYIQIVYNECSCGSARKNSIAEMARKHGICVAQYIEVKQRDTYYEFYELLRRKPHAKLVIIFLSPHILPNFMRDLNVQMTKRGEFQFLGSDAWGENYELLQYDVVKGSLCVAMQVEEVKDLRAFIQQQLPNKHTYHPWLEEYLQMRQSCYFDWSYDKLFPRQCTDDILPPQEKDFKIDFTSNLAANSLLALLTGSAEFYKKVCGSASKYLCQEFVRNPTGLYEEMKKVSMDISGTGSNKIFDSIGDGNLGYQILNVKEDSDGVLTFIKVGRYNTKAGLDIYTENVAFPTAEAIVSSCPNEQACQDCFTKEVPTPEPSPTSVDGVKIALGILFGVFALIALVLLVLLIHEKRKNKEDPYITPSADLVRPETVGKSYSPYHSGEKIEETSY